MINKSVKQICLPVSATIREAMKVLAKNKPAESNLPGGIVLVLDKKERLIGIATDGDLRRALASGADMDSRLEAAMNKDVFYVEGPMPHSEMLNTAVEKLRERGWHRNRLDKIVVVDADKRVLDVVSFFELWQSSDIRFKRVGVIGLGFVGLTLGLTLADIGFNVLGVDKAKWLTDSVRAKKPPFFEEGLQVLLDDHVGKRFKVTDKFSEKDICDVYFIAVGTPLNDKRVPDMAYIKGAAESVGKILKKGDSVILRSTVPLGTTRDVVVPILEKLSGLTAGEDFLVVFAPERTIEGKALEELRSLPQVIGGINRVSANAAAGIFSLMTDTVLIVDTLEEAEMVKLINNTYRDVSFAFANEVALVSKRWGIDTNKVINAANTGYPRSQVPRPSPGVGGYCLEKDPYIYVAGAKARGYEPMLVQHAREVHERILRSVADEALEFLKKTGNKKGKRKIFILGFAFKGNPPTSDMRGSTTVKLVDILRKSKLVDIFGYDALIPQAEIKKLGVTPVSVIREGFKGADAVIVMNNHPELKELDMRGFMKLANKGAMLYDTWALYSRDEIEKVAGVDYRRL